MENNICFEMWVNSCLIVGGLVSVSVGLVVLSMKLSVWIERCRKMNRWSV